MSSPSPSSDPLDAAATQKLHAEFSNILLQHPEIQKIDLTTVRGTRLRFPEANQAAPSFCPDSGTKATFDKPYTPPAGLIPILESRGLFIPDPSAAARWFEKVGYYRLSGYALHYRLRESAVQLTEAFQPGTTF